MLKFDPEGNLLASWGGAPGQPWVKNEHGIHVDREGNVWVGGNNDGDQILKFAPDGKFLQQIGKDDGTKGSLSQTRLGRPAHMITDDAAGEIYVADGYGNHRIVVFDAKTGAFKRMWGAYGKPPSDDKMPPYKPDAKLSEQFSNPVHCVRLSNDGLVYVCDRANDRIQVFRKDGDLREGIPGLGRRPCRTARSGTWCCPRTRSRSSSSWPTAPTAISSRWTGNPARNWPNGAATAASRASSNGFTTSLSIPAAISILPR